MEVGEVSYAKKTRFENDVAGLQKKFATSWYVSRPKLSLYLILFDNDYKQLKYQSSRLRNISLLLHAHSSYCTGRKNVEKIKLRLDHCRRKGAKRSLRKFRGLGWCVCKSFRKHNANFYFAGWNELCIASFNLKFKIYININCN